MNKNFIALGCLLCAVAVATGALGAHTLKEKLDPYLLDVYKTAVQYHFLHAIGIILLSILPLEFQTRSIKISLWLFLSGIIFFSGSLYLLSTRTLWTSSNLSWLGPITPLGGLFFIVGWIAAATIIFSKKSHPQKP